MLCRVLIVLALLFITACGVEGPMTGPEVSEPNSILIDGSTTGNAHFFFLPPLVNSNPSSNGVVDTSLRPRVEICEWSGDSCIAGPPAFTFTTTSGPDGRVVMDSDSHYMVTWDTQLDGVEPGKVFRASVSIVSLELGSVHIQIGQNGNEVKNIDTGENIGLVDGRTLPLRFRIEEGAVEAAEMAAEADCHDEFGNVIDCDVVVVSGTEGGSATVFEDPAGAGQTLAALVLIPPDDAVDGNGNPVSDFLLTLQHVEAEPAPPEDIATQQQVPFFVEVTAEDEAGNPVFFQTGATLVLCQPPDLGDSEASFFIPDALHLSLVIFRVHLGVTEILPTTIDDGNCPGGLHGGLNTVRIGAFSGFGTTLPTAPSASTAVVPDGTVGGRTAIDIQARVATAEGALDQVLGGDAVVATVSGANTASPPVTDNGDGTYTTQYTPKVAGTDSVDIRIRNLVTGDFEPISGSPFISMVAGAGAADLIIEGLTHSPAEPTDADEMEFGVTVKNVGTLATGPFYVIVNTSKDGALFEATTLVGLATEGSSLAAGESRTLCCFRAVRAGGEYSQTALVDFHTQAELDNQVPESNEANNTLTDVYTVTRVGSLAFIQQPTDTESGQAIAPPLQISVLDAAGNPLSEVVQVTVGNDPNNPPECQVLQTREIAIEGVATFANVLVNGVCSGARVAVTAGGGDIDFPIIFSVPFDITPLLGG